MTERQEDKVHPSKSPTAGPEDGGNDDDAEYDQFDDVLDQFTSATPQPPPVPPNTLAPSGMPSTKTSMGPEAADMSGISDELAAAFQKELMKGMEDLFQGLSTSESPVSSTSHVEGKEDREKAMKALWEAMLIEEMDGGRGGGRVGDGEGLDVQGMKLGEEYIGGTKGKEAVGNDDKQSQGPIETDDFQKTIRATMEKLKGSESSLKSETSSEEALSSFLSQLSALGEGGGEENEEELQRMLEGMMGQLMSKEVLEEPLSELASKFPPYLEQHRSTLSSKDLKRYESQSECITKIMNVFNDPAYKDDDNEWNTKVVNLMTEMQSHGSPPAEIMGPLPPGMALGPDGMPSLPDGCVIA